MKMRKVLTVGVLSTAALFAGAAPALASTPVESEAAGVTGGIGALCDFGTYGDFSKLCDPATLLTPAEYCDFGTYGDLTVLCDPATALTLDKYLDLGTYGDYSWLLRG
ncbi:hypothetical protein SAMN05421810_102595 [Amycolatopsis arida]|uniref:Uncharacterized protein n=1 Tax=Amycolatopsis arida TaxID=587909 RepID=A0A1I5QEN8_9PSEU|nr:hypothetical protein [Amycolatopsis arida]TDX98799.1 hypothetical protein CLV69_101596 [Amycolatopsis arida]SFP44316.1 hypothetical protein SAMN05421810_102595 [Amycolatopsis arida]